MFREALLSIPFPGKAIALAKHDDTNTKHDHTNTQASCSKATSMVSTEPVEMSTTRIIASSTGINTGVLSRVRDFP